MKLFYILFLGILFSSIEAQSTWTLDTYANFSKYAEENHLLGKKEKDQFRVVMMGNSITENWVKYRPRFFASGTFIGRGISGQVTSQMLLRFRKDVLDLDPDIVVILAGTNDIAENSGPIPLEKVAGNIFSMAEIARANGIEVVLCSVPPAIDFPWKRGLAPAMKILKLNNMIRAYASKNNIPYADYHAGMADQDGGMKVPDYTSADDLVHPNKSGYILMETILTPIISQIKR